MRLPPLLDTTGLSEAELSAIRLDGDAFPLADGLAAVDAPIDEGLRAAAVALSAPLRGLVAEGWTAAWIHGATGRLRRPLDFAVDVRRRERTRRVALREVLFEREDVVLLGGLAVTAGLRTAYDLARLDRDPSLELTSALETLIASAGCTPARAAALFSTWAAAPYKRRGIARIAALEAGSTDQAALTR